MESILPKICGMIDEKLNLLHMTCEMVDVTRSSVISCLYNSVKTKVIYEKNHFCIENGRLQLPVVITGK